MTPRPFSPSGNTVNLSISSTSQRVLASQQGGVQQLRIYNDGTATVWVKLGDATVTAVSSTDYPIPSGAIEVITINPALIGPIYIAGIAAGSTGSIYFTIGAGI